MLNEICSEIKQSLVQYAKIDNEYSDKVMEFAKYFDNAVQAANNLPPIVQNRLKGFLMGKLSVKI